ncbi:hypothetical protein GCM10020331_095860 [Ectobacillus funiculus]
MIYLGKTAVAIGGNSVLGSSIVKGLAAHGANIAIVGRNLEKAQAVAGEIEEKWRNCKGFSSRCQLA